MERACRAEGVEAIEKLLSWAPKTLLRAIIGIEIILIVGLVGWYFETRHSTLLLVIMILIATIPLDIIILHSVMTSSAKTVAEAILQALASARARGIVALRRGPRTYIAARLDKGDLHIIASPTSIEAVLIESPTYLPAPHNEGLTSSLIRRRGIGGKECRKLVEEKDIQAVLPEPGTGCPRQVQGKARLVAYSCGPPSGESIVEALLGLVSPGG